MVALRICNAFKGFRVSWLKGQHITYPKPTFDLLVLRFRSLLIPGSCGLRVWSVLGRVGFQKNLGTPEDLFAGHGGASSQLCFSLPRGVELRHGRRQRLKEMPCQKSKWTGWFSRGFSSNPERKQVLSARNPRKSLTLRNPKGPKEPQGSRSLFHAPGGCRAGSMCTPLGRDRFSVGSEAVGLLGSKTSISPNTVGFVGLLALFVLLAC